MGIYKPAVFICTPIIPHYFFIFLRSQRRKNIVLVIKIKPIFHLMFYEEISLSIRDRWINAIAQNREVTA